MFGTSTFYEIAEALQSFCWKRSKKKGERRRKQKEESRKKEEEGRKKKEKKKKKIRTSGQDLLLAMDRNLRKRVKSRVFF